MAKRSFEEERALLLANEEGFEVSHRNYYPAFETAIAKGVTNHVGKWPSHLFVAFLTGSLVFATFILFALVTLLFCIPTTSYSCRLARNVDFTEYPNVYFVKHKNRTWSRMELCYVESSARENPEIKVYLINLSTDLPYENNFSPMTNGNYKNKRDMKRGIWEKRNNSIVTVDLSSNITEESTMRNELGARYANVRNVDVTMKDFFKGSILSEVFHELDTKTLEIAARATILWNTPGIALEPSEFRRIFHSKRYLCKQDCKAIKNAATNLDGSFQASAVPCQAFVGSLIRQIASDGISANRDVVKGARDNFCRSPRECPGLEIYNDSLKLSQSPHCPAIYPTGISSSIIKIFTTRGTGVLG